LWEAYGCAPLVVTGVELEAARAVISAHVQVTSRLHQDAQPQHYPNKPHEAMPAA
jgi:hypothetical protein